MNKIAKNLMVIGIIAVMTVMSVSCGSSCKSDEDVTKVPNLETPVFAASGKSMHELQQEFVDLKFGMFNHFSTSTFSEEDWGSPDFDPADFNPTELDCNVWAEAAQTANMKFGCLSVKHHAGFCLWDTKTTEYSVMNSPLHRDIVREYVDAFKARGMETIFHFSILDLNQKLRPHMITREKIDRTKSQLQELLTNYGPIRAIMIDGWDAGWARISYEDVSFPEIYSFIKSIQPDCLVMDLNGGKYPSEVLFYGDLKPYEQGAGQYISTEGNVLPSMSCYPLQRTWFWKKSFPTEPVKDPELLVERMVKPYNAAHCTFILNVAPNDKGLIDDNALEALKKIGELWHDDGVRYDFPEIPEPIVEENVAKNRPSESSWSEDCEIMDMGNDDNFWSYWASEPSVKEPFWEVTLDKKTTIHKVVMTESDRALGAVKKYRVEYLNNGKWSTVFEGATEGRVKINTFEPVEAEAVRFTFLEFEGGIKISEFGVYTPLP